MEMETPHSGGGRVWRKKPCMAGRGWRRKPRIVGGREWRRKPYMARRGWRRKPCMGRGDDIEGNPALMVKKTLLGRRGMENETLVGPGGGWRRKPCIGEGEDVMK